MRLPSTHAENPSSRTSYPGCKKSKRHHFYSNLQWWKCRRVASKVSLSLGPELSVPTWYSLAAATAVTSTGNSFRCFRIRPKACWTASDSALEELKSKDEWIVTVGKIEALGSKLSDKATQVLFLTGEKRVFSEEWLGCIHTYTLRSSLIDHSPPISKYSLPINDYFYYSIQTSLKGRHTVLKCDSSIWYNLWPRFHSRPRWIHSKGWWNINNALLAAKNVCFW